jgi:hypothetical protein
VRELSDEGSGDGGLARDVLTFYDQDPASDRAVIERGTQGGEVVLQPLVVKLAPAGTVESEPRREIGIDLGLVLARQLQLPDADEPADTLVSVYVSTHRSIIPDDGNLRSGRGALLPLVVRPGHLMLDRRDARNQAKPTAVAPRTENGHVALRGGPRARRFLDLVGKRRFTTSPCGRVSDRPRGPRNKHGQGLIGSPSW